MQWLPITGVESPESRDGRAISAYYEQVFRYGQNWDVILAALRAEDKVDLDKAVKEKEKEKEKKEKEKLASTPPMVLILVCDFEAAHAGLSTASQYLLKAKQFLDIAEGEIAQLNEREKLYVHAYESWYQGDLITAFNTFVQIVDKYPADMFAMKRGQLVAFFRGDVEGMLDITRRAEKGCAGRPYYHSMLAFALEQCGHLQEAELEGKRACDIQLDDAWAHHAVAHSMYFQGQLAEGLRWLESKQELWENCMSFMYTHNWFHVALFHLDLDQISAALRVLDNHAWPFPSNDTQQPENITTTNTSTPAFPRNNKKNQQDQLGALNLLLKLELRGPIFFAGKVSDEDHWLTERWREVVDYAAKNEGHLDPLFDLLLAFGLGRMERWSDLDAHRQSMENSVKSMGEQKKEHSEEAEKKKPKGKAETESESESEAEKKREREEEEQTHKEEARAAKDKRKRKDELERVWLPMGKAVRLYLQATYPSNNNSNNVDAQLSNYKQALELMQGCIEELSIVGGSSEQRECLCELYATILYRVARQSSNSNSTNSYSDTAKAYLTAKLAERPSATFYAQLLSGL